MPYIVIAVDFPSDELLEEIVKSCPLEACNKTLEGIIPGLKVRAITFKKGIPNVDQNFLG